MRGSAIFQGFQAFNYPAFTVKKSLAHLGDLSHSMACLSSVYAADKQCVLAQMTKLGRTLTGCACSRR